MWVRTVAVDMFRVSVISGLVAPWATRRRIWVSRAVRSSMVDGVAGRGARRWRRVRRTRGETKFPWECRPTRRDERTASLDSAVSKSFEDSGGTYGSVRVHADLVEAGGKVSACSVAVSMVRQGLVARSGRRRGNLTRPDKHARPLADLVERDFTAPAPNVK